MNIIAKKPNSFYDFENLIKEFLSRYEYSDAYFFYRNQKIFLTKIGYNFLSYRWNWDSLNKNILEIIPYRHGEEDNSGQFFYNSDFLFSDLDLFYLPLNFFTNGVVYASNAANTRTSSNTYAQVLAIGNEIISYAVDSIEPSPYSSPKPVTIKTETGELILKREPNGIAMQGSVFSFVPYKKENSATSMEQLIIFPTKYISVIIIKYKTDNFPNNEQSELITINENYKYFSINLPKKYDLGEIYLDTQAQTNVIDCILISSTPLIGNNNIFGFKDNQTICYKKIPVEELERGFFKIKEGTIVKEESTLLRCQYIKFDTKLVGKYYGKFLECDQDTSLFYQAFTKDFADSIVEVNQDNIGLLEEIWLNYRDFSKPFVFGFTKNTHCKALVDTNESINGEKTQFNNTLQNIEKENLEFLSFDFLTNSIYLNSLFDFSLLGNDFTTDTTKTIFEFNKDITNGIFPMDSKDLILYDNDPLSRVIRNFKDSFDLYPILRCDIVTEYMIELKIKNLKEFKKQEEYYVFETDFQLTSYENVRFTKISLYVYNEQGWNSNYAYSFYCSAAKIYYQKQQWLFQIDELNNKTIRYGDFVENGFFKIFFTSQDTFLDYAIKIFLILE